MTIIEFGEDEDFDYDRDEGGTVDDNLGDHVGDSTQQMGYTYGSLTRGLVAYYPMEQGQGQVLHDGALDNLGQINGATWNGSGQVGDGALDFDGTDDLAESVDTTPVASAESFTISAWANFDDLSQTRSVLYGVNDSESDAFSIYAISSGAARFAQNDGNSSSIAEAGSLSTSTWYHISGVHNSDDSTLRLYLDGVEIDTASSSTSGGREATQFTIGEFPFGGDNLMDGLIDDVRIYDRALSSTEISELASLTAPDGRLLQEADVPTQSDNGVSRYEFENDVTDSWGSNDGTDNTSAGFVDGVFGQAKDFDGTDDYVTIPDLGAVFSYSNNHTISCWVRIDSFGDNFQRFLDIKENYYHEHKIDQNGTDEFHYTAFDGSNSLDLSFGGFSTGEWIHYCLTFEGGNIVKGYINGEVRDTGTPPSSSDSVSGSNYLYRDSSNNYTDGAAEDLRIFSDALSPSEVETLYNKGAYRLPRSDTL